MGGNGDADGDVSGEEAAWRDLIARFDLPVDTTTTRAPWPAREDLTETSSDRPRPERDTAVGREQGGPGSSGSGGPVSRAGPASLSGPGGIPGPVRRPGPGGRPGPADRPGPDRPAETGDRGAGTGPAGEAGTEPAGAGSAGPAGSGDAATGNGDVPGALPPAAGSARGGRSAGGFPGDRAHIVRRADSVPRPAPAGDDADDDDRYVPPPPEPLPQLGSVTKGAWAALLGGPGYLLVATLAHWEVSDWAALVAIIAFVGGFATLVLRMSDRPRDDDDDGAVV